MQEKINQLKLRFRQKYDYLQEEDVDELFEEAQMIYLELQYPLHKNVHTLPDNNRAFVFVRRLMKEILDRSGCSSATAYSENGLSIKFDSSMVSLDLMSLITPYGKIVRRG